MQQLTLNWLNINDWVNYFAFWEEEQPYNVQYDLIPNKYNSRPYINNYRQQEKIIKIKWTLKSPSTEWLSLIIRNFKNKIIWENKSITVVDRFWTTYTWKYTYTWMTFDSNHYNLIFIKYEANIIITELLESSILVTASSSATWSLWSTLSDNYWWISYPYYRFTWNTWSSLSKIQITLYDNSISYPEDQKTNNIIIYPSWWVNGDYIDINGKNKTIIKNGSNSVEYYGEIWLIQPWISNWLQVLTTGTSINFTFTRDFYITLN